MEGRPVSDDAHMDKLADWLSGTWGERPDTMEIIHRERTVWPGSPNTEVEVLFCRYGQPSGYRGIGITGEGVMPYAFTPVEAIAGAFDWDAVPIADLKCCHAGMQFYLQDTVAQQLAGAPAAPGGITEEDRAVEAEMKAYRPEVQGLIRVLRLGDWPIFLFRQHTEEYGDEIYVTDGGDGHAFTLDDPISAFGPEWFFLGDFFFQVVAQMPPQPS